MQHGARAGRESPGLTPAARGCMAAGDAASCFAISFHTDIVFPAFSSLLLLISGLWGREWKGRKGKEKKKKRKGKRTEKKRKVIADP